MTLALIVVGVVAWLVVVLIVLGMCRASGLADEHADEAIWRLEDDADHGR